MKRNEQQAILKAQEVGRAMLSMARDDLLSFTRITMPSYKVNWHHRIIARELSKWVRRETKNLMIFMPPRVGKTELVSRRCPAWILGRNPKAKIIATAYAAELATSNNRDVQRIMDSDRYLAVFPETVLPGENVRTDAKGSWLRNSDTFEVVEHGGMYRSAGVGGGITGMGADFIFIDDPVKNHEEAYSDTYRQKVWDWYTSTLFTRREKDAGICLVMTRWHEDDLAGRIQKANLEYDSGWKVVKFPMLLGEPIEGDPRQQGEPLWPWKYDLKECETIRATSERDWTALYQQDPKPMEGGLFKREWWALYDDPPKPEEILRKVQFWDCAHKVGIDNDYSVCATWALTQRGYFLLDLWRGKLEAPQLEQQAELQYYKHLPESVVIEDKASGIGLIQSLRQKSLIPVIAYDPKARDKEIRAISATPLVQAGKCHLPRRHQLTEDFISEHERFPAAAHDDMVDTTSMMAEHMRQSAFQPRVRML